MSKQTLIALPTVKTQSATSSSEEPLVAVAVLTPERASEILRQMESVTKMARRWVGVYKLSSFDGNTFYVPQSSMQTPPSPTDFRVLDPGFTTPMMTQLVRFQIGIIPGAVIWEAFDAENRFMVNTIELSSEVLRAISLGTTFNPGDTSEALKSVVPAEPVVDADPRWQQNLM
jgi:hypothetical protein